MKIKTLIILVLLIPVSGKSYSQHSIEYNRNYIVSKLNSNELNNLYSNTYYSVLDRLDSDGYFPESIIEGTTYPGMYPRTIGALILLFIETGRYEEAERSLKCLLDFMKNKGLYYVPHVVNKENGKLILEDDIFQIDAQAHIILGWSRLALEGKNKEFIDTSWLQVAELMDKTCDRGNLLYSRWSGAPKLVLNTAFEHSREGHYWVTYDLLTQSFVGAALDNMIKLAKLRNDNTHAKHWDEKLRILSEGINNNMLLERDGKQTYIEMLIPNGNGGNKYTGMGWVNFSPVAAGWQCMDQQVLVNTVDYMEKNYLQSTNGIYWMPTDIFPDGKFVNEVVGKGIGWQLDFARITDNNKRIYEILDLIDVSNKGSRVYMEFAWLDGNGYKRNTRITNEDVLGKMKDLKWKMREAGNGEQNVWFCWAIARLRKSMGLNAEPKRI